MVGALTRALAPLAGRLGQAAGPERVRAGPGGGPAAGTASLEALAARNAGLALKGPGAPAGLSHILPMPLDQFAREGLCLEVRVPWLDVTLWLVPEERDAEALGRGGVSHGRIWTAAELMAVIALPDWSPEIARRLALAKRELEGHIIEVRRR